MQLTGKNYLGQTESSEGSQVFQAINPSNGQTLEVSFSEATQDEVNKSAEKAEVAFRHYSKTSGAVRAGFLRAIAREIMVAHRGDLRLDLLGHTQTVSMTRQGLQSVVARQTLLYSVARPGPVVNILQEFVVPIKYAYELLVAGE